MKISNKKVIGKQFFYDGCHKIYIIEDDEDIKEFTTNNGYTMSDILDIKDLVKFYLNSCPLVFISNCKVTKQYVKQGQRQFTITYDNGKKEVIKY